MASYENACKGCGRLFRAGQKRALWCSQACYRRAYRAARPKPPCMDCGAKLTHARAKRCKPCASAKVRERQARKRKPEARKSCQHCGSLFNTSQPGARYCPACRQPGKGGLRAEYRQNTWKGAGPFSCPVCDSEFYAKHRVQRYCGHACAVESLRRRAAPARQARHILRQEIRTYARWARRARTRRKREAERLARMEATVRRQALIEPRPCRECGTMFKPKSDRGTLCSNECRRKEDKRRVRLKRKAKLKAVWVESVNPTLVFQRDRWICQLCGCKTFRNQRGSCNPRAPELDHIIPLSKGGEHSYLNTQCACRMCNADKSDTELGQLRMFSGVASG